MTYHLMPSYRPASVAFVRGEGATLWDTEGNAYLDAISGLGVCALGHAHPDLAHAIADQAKTLMHTSNGYTIPLQNQLAEKLCAHAGMDQAFFCNSGAEANECAIKLARLYGHQKGVEQPEIIVTQGAFHGRTLATLSATGNRKVQAGFEPLVQGFVRAPYNDIPVLENIAANSHNVVAIMIESIQGESGIHIPDPDYLAKVRALCQEKNWLMILDEVQTGIGRTGAWFAYQHAGIKPDVVTAAKALGNGFPIGACLARASVGELFQPGKHGSTFGGNPLACRAALSVLETLEKTALLANAKTQGELIVKGLTENLADYADQLQIRGKGLMIGIECQHSCLPLKQQALDKGLLINICGQEKIIRLLPPLIFTPAQSQKLVDTLSQLLINFLSHHEKS